MDIVHPLELMMQDTQELLDRVQADRKRAQQNLRKAKEALAQAQAEIDRLDTVMTVLGSYGMPVPADSRRSESPTGRIRRIGKCRAVVTDCVAYIAAHGPMPIGALVHVVDEDLGPNPRQVLASYLSRDERVYHEAGFGWKVVSTVKNDGGGSQPPESTDPL